jgi:hypothetical protein
MIFQFHFQSTPSKLNAPSKLVKIVQLWLSSFFLRNFFRFGFVIQLLSLSLTIVVYNEREIFGRGGRRLEEILMYVFFPRSNVFFYFERRHVKKKNSLMKQSFQYPILIYKNKWTPRPNLIKVLGAYLGA